MSGWKRGKKGGIRDHHGLHPVPGETPLREALNLVATDAFCGCQVKEGEGHKDQMDSEALKDQLCGMKFVDTPA